MRPPSGLRASKVIAVHLNYRSRAGRARAHAVRTLLLPQAAVHAGRRRRPRPPARDRAARLRGRDRRRHRHARARVAPRRRSRTSAGSPPRNDAGVADFRWNDRGSNLFSKGQDGFTPIGPAVAAGEVDPSALVLRTRVNGEVVQEDVTANLIFPFADLIADITRFITLEPGDVILTGTPTGTGVLDLGDVVEVELEGAGSVRSTVVEADHDIEPFGAMPKVTPEVARLGDRRARAARARAHARGVGDAPPRRHRDAHPAAAAARHAQLVDPRRALHAAGPAAGRLRADAALRRAARGRARRRHGAAERAEGRHRGDRAGRGARHRGARGAGRRHDRRHPRRARARPRGHGRSSPTAGCATARRSRELDIPTYFQAPHGSVLGLIHYPLESRCRSRAAACSSCPAT